jgi:hypothetical protein
LGGLTGLNHELGSNEHVSGISSASPYHTTSVNHANTFPPARHSSAMPMGYDVPPHLVTVGVHLPIFIPPSLMVAVSKGPRGYQGIESQRQLDGHPTPGMTPCIPFAHGPPRLEYYDAPAITVRVSSPNPFPRALTACLTVPLTIGEQRRRPQSCTSLLQCSRAFPRNSQRCIFRSASHRRPQRSCQSLPPQPWLKRGQASH